MKISLLTGGGGDRYYELGLLGGLLNQNIIVDFVGGNSVADNNIFLERKNVNFINIRGDQNPSALYMNKIIRVVKYYFRLIKYAYTSDSEIFHIQWLNKFEHFDRTILNIYYKALGKKIVFTAHNVDANAREGKSSIINRFTLKIFYMIVDRIIVHTEKMKRQLIDKFNINDGKICVINYGINNMVFKSDIGNADSRGKLGINQKEKILLFFGNITNYKGLDILIETMNILKSNNKKYTLVIAGRVQKKYMNLWEEIKNKILEYKLENHIRYYIGFIDDKDIELYFSAADVLILPYKNIYQSGIIFLSYNFGLPVIATDVGSLKEEIISGETGFVCKTEDPKDLYDKIVGYFESDIYNNLNENREKIYKYASDKYSWEKIGEKTRIVYENMLIN